MKQTLLVIVILLVLSCKKDEERNFGYARHEFELKVVNKTDIDINIQVVLLGASTEAFPGGEYGTSFTVNSNQIKEEIIRSFNDKFNPPRLMCNAYGNGRQLLFLLHYPGPYEETQQVIMLITFDGTDYVFEYL